MDLFGEPPPPESSPEKEDAPLLETQTQEPGLTHPRLSNICIGHARAERHLQSLFSENKLPHGLVFSGAKGIGKSTFAFRFARYVLKYGQKDSSQSAMFAATPEIFPQNMDVPSDDRISRLISAQAHPDLLVIEPEKAILSVDEIRRIMPFLRMTASEGGWRIVIIDNADTMNRAAQNALLKILEEPPENTLIILIAHRAGMLIPTIKSRTQTVRFSTPSATDFEHILISGGHELDADQLETLYHLSEGSIGTALEYIDQGGLDTLARILVMLESYPEWDWPTLHVIADEFARSDQETAYKSFTQLMLLSIKSILHAKARGQTIQSPVLKSSAFEALQKQSSLEHLLKICENLEDHFRKVEFANLDKRQGVLQAFSILAA